jgi:UDP-N-acetylglucosamine--N-acetylmuramyl-(pentapeptide) pyrophosphoryl-undecaprenol N-acetylglucosamine transferase
VNVLIAGGGTAGHVFPAIALAAELRSDGHDVRFAGMSTGQENLLVREAGFPFVAVEARPLERRVSVRAVAAPFAAVRSVKACRPLAESADVVVGMGGYVSVPVALAALRSRRPLVLHEQNAVPGLANRTFARPARTVAL